MNKSYDLFAEEDCFGPVSQKHILPSNADYCDMHHTYEEIDSPAAYVGETPNNSEVKENHSNNDATDGQSSSVAGFFKVVSNKRLGIVSFGCAGERVSEREKENAAVGLVKGPPQRSAAALEHHAAASGLSAKRTRVRPGRLFLVTLSWDVELFGSVREPLVSCKSETFQLVYNFKSSLEQYFKALLRLRHCWQFTRIA